MGSLVTPLRKIHPTAVVSPGAVIGKNVEIKDELTVVASLSGQFN